MNRIWINAAYHFYPEHAEHGAYNYIRWAGQMDIAYVQCKCHEELRVTMRQVLDYQYAIGEAK